MIKNYSMYMNENTNIDFKSLEFREIKQLFSNIEHWNDHWYTRAIFDNGYGMVIEIVRKDPKYKKYTWNYYIFRPKSSDIWKRANDVDRDEVEKIFNKVQNLEPLKQIFNEIDPLGEEEWE